MYEEVEGLQLLPRSDNFSEKFPVPEGHSGSGSNLVAVAGKNGVVRIFSLEGVPVDGQGEEDDDTAGRKKSKKIKKATSSSKDGEEEEQQQLRRLTCRCVMTQDNASASHRAGYTSLLLDRRRAGLIAVTADHNLVLLEAAAGKSGGAIGSLVTRRQIVGYNDEVIDLKSFPSGDVFGGNEGESWVAVATNSPQVRLFELGGFSCRLLDGHTDTVLALDVAPDG